jgi:hypothetical protein
MSFYANMKHLKSEINRPPAGGWLRENKWGASHTAGITPAELNKVLAELIAEELDATHEQKEQLKDWLMDQAAEQIAEHLLGDSNPVGLAMKAAKFTVWWGRNRFFHHKRLHAPAGINAFEPDEEPGEFVDFLLWDWKLNNEWRDKSNRKSGGAAATYGM